MITFEGSSSYDSILEYCGYGNSEGRYYVDVGLNYSNGEVKRLYSGDSGARWVQEMARSFEGTYDFYDPGYSREFYDFNLDEGFVRVKVEVFVNADV